ncbi:hypothetical protein Glove_267g1 [Diversispora epigaea]|uniref:Fork-head domain-containing protein n=1 Tax=Diversispora epigaea TaxID=1348612 RepID=A0A397I7D4_9GLOM|nr:hypothetical protein Glove_267g1 [Diversispora epigaea]
MAAAMVDQEGSNSITNDNATYARLQLVDQEGSNSINNDNASVDQPKPSLTYMSLIGQAILAAPDKKCQLNEICIWITKTYPFYKMENKGWQNAIRHNLTLCPAFFRCERDGGKRRKKAWTIPDEYQECFVNGIYINYKAKEIKAREESASAIGSEETIGSSNGTVEIQQSEVPKLTPPSQESSTNQPQSPLLFTSSPNLSTAPTQSIFGSGSMHTLRQSEITFNIIMRYLNATEASSSSSPAPCNYVNMAKVENIQDNGILNYEIKETEANKIEIPTWELGVTEYCCDTGLEYDQRTYFVSQLNVPEIYDCPDFIYIGCTDPQKLVQVSPGTRELGYIDQGIFNLW